MNKRGLFITFEGGEGVGKSTNIEHLRGMLNAAGVELVVTREPGGTQLGEELRELLLTLRQRPISSLAELLLVFASRAQHISEVIEPALAAGKWVLCDRFTDATFAYQGGGRELGSSVIAELECLVQGELRPDFTVLLDVDVGIGMARASGRGELDRIEQEALDFFERVRAAYIARAQESPERFKVIDAGQSLDAVKSDITAFATHLISRFAEDIV